MNDALSAANIDQATRARDNEKSMQDALIKILTDRSAVAPLPQSRSGSHSRTTV